MTDEEVERIARILQAEVYPYGPPRPSPPWETQGAVHEFWRAKARAGVQPGQAAAEAAAKQAANPEPMKKARPPVKGTGLLWSAPRPTVRPDHRENHRTKDDGGDDRQVEPEHS